MDPKLFDKMFDVAKSSLSHSHSPYSNYKVASAVLMDDGAIYGGCNVENASYGATVCAERVAIWKGVSEGAKKIKSIMVMIDSPTPWPPCGMCRQVMAEFGDPKTEVLLVNLERKTKITNMEELCPSFFGPENLTNTNSIK